MAMKIGDEAAAVKSEPNVVPMIDVMLVLLIIFMIITPMLAAGFQHAMPEAQNIDAAEVEEGDVVLGIDNGGLYYLDPGTGTIGPIERMEVGSPGMDQGEKLGIALLEIYEERTNRIMYFRADQELRYEHIEDAMEIARKAGVVVLAAITEELRTPTER